MGLWLVPAEDTMMMMLLFLCSVEGLTIKETAGWTSVCAVWVSLDMPQYFCIWPNYKYVLYYVSVCLPGPRH